MYLERIIGKKAKYIPKKKNTEAFNGSKKTSEMILPNNWYILLR